jgi:hypothetical protein
MSASKAPMNAQSSPAPRSAASEASSTQAKRSPTKPTERAFVVQFDPIPGARSRFRGRAELVASGEATHFRSLKQLVEFMVGILRRRPEDVDGD